MSFIFFCAFFPELNFYNTKANNERFTADTMASQFSGVLQLTDLDDFITPSQVTTLSLRAIATFIYSVRTILLIVIVVEGRRLNRERKG